MSPLNCHSGMSVATLKEERRKAESIVTREALTSFQKLMMISLLYGFCQLISLLAGSSFPQVDALTRGWLFIVMWAFVVPLLILPLLCYFLGCQMGDYAQHCTLCTCVLILILNFFACWAINYATDVESLRLDTRDFTSADPCDRMFRTGNSTEFNDTNPHAFFKIENFRSWDTSSWEIKWTVHAKSGTRNEATKGVAIHRNGACTINLHHEIQGNYREKLMDGGEIYCGWESFYVPGRRFDLPVSQERRYREAYPTTPLCRGFRPESANASFAFGIFIAGWVVLGLTFILFCCFVVYILSRPTNMCMYDKEKLIKEIDKALKEKKPRHPY